MMENATEKGEAQARYLLPCELGSSEKSNLLEAINLALFNLNNEEIDLNLRTTGT